VDNVTVPVWQDTRTQADFEPYGTNRYVDGVKEVIQTYRSDIFNRTLTETFQ